MKTAVIIGGGPAGCQCALWLKMLGLEPLIIEKTPYLGGLQHSNPYQNHWLIGMRHTTGREFSQRVQQHIQELEIPTILNSTVSSFQAIDGGYTVQVGKQMIETANIVIATGSKPHLVNLDPTNVVAIDVATQDYHERVKNRAVSSRGGKTWEANLPEVFASQAEKLLDKRGFIATDANCLTPINRIYAIGEAANRMPPCVSTAMADGVIAAKAIQSQL